MQRTSHPGVSLSPTWGQRGTQATVLSLGGGGGRSPQEPAAGLQRSWEVSQPAWDSGVHRPQC